MIPLVLVAGFAMAQQSVQPPQFVNADEARLVSVPGAPECATFAVEHGNPKAKGSVTLVKLASGCTVPMHWHSTNEQLKVCGCSPCMSTCAVLKAGGYYFMPAHHLHQLSCANGCTFHRAVDGPIDIHYVDAAGNEISAEKALAAFGERPATALAQK